MRIASKATAAASAPLPATPTGGNGFAFQNALAASAAQAGDGTSSAKIQSATGAANRDADKQEKQAAASVVDGTGLLTTIPLPDLPMAPAVPPPSQMADASPKSADTSGFSESSAWADLAQGMVASDPTPGLGSATPSPVDPSATAATSPDGNSQTQGKAGATDITTAASAVAASTTSTAAKSDTAAAVAANAGALAAAKAAVTATADATDTDTDTTAATTTTQSAVTKMGGGLLSQVVNQVLPSPQQTQPVSDLLSNGKHPGKLVPKDAPPVGQKSADAAPTTAAAKSKASETTDGGNDPSSQNAQTNSQSSQHSQAGASSVIAGPSLTDGSSAQIANFGTHLSHGTDAAPAAATGADAPSGQGLQGAGTPATPVAGDGVASGAGINTASVMQKMSGTEMRVGMNSSEFGNISIRTTVSQQQMFTQISLDHSELGQAISAHVPMVQTKIGNDTGLHSLIEVNQQAAFSSGGQGNSQPRDQSSTPRFATLDASASGSDPEAGFNAAAWVGTADSSRLDIRA